MKLILKSPIHKGWSELNLHTFQDKHGSHVDREVFNTGNAVAVLPYNPFTETVLLINQFCAGAGEDLITACAGKIDIGESGDEAAAREAGEELGYRLNNLEHLGTFYVSPGANTEQITLFAATYGRNTKIGTGGGLASEHEDIEVLELSLVQALRMVEDGAIKDMKTIMLLDHIKREWA